MSIDAASRYFRVGGTLHLDTPSYVKRPADAQLFELVLAGQFCYVLTPRQMGKSSLMLRTAEQLHQHGTKTAIVDLSSLGTQVTSEQWYLGIIKRLSLELALTTDPEQWWRERNGLTAVQRFTDFLHDVVLTKIDTPIVIFIDEIDSTLKLPFTDDFFAAIRAVYNRRASQADYDRLTFVLLGVAIPTDLIKDASRTPFNIGQAIDLREFSRQDADPLQQGLEQSFPQHGQRILDRIFYWTNGHPYLTQKLCSAVVKQPNGDWLDQDVDRLVDALFFAEDAKKEDNLQFVRSNIEASPERQQLLRLYKRVYQGKEIKENGRSLWQNRLRLVGLVGTQEGILHVRNNIYKHVFDQDWIKENTPINWTRRLTLAIVSVSALIVLLVISYLPQQMVQNIAKELEIPKGRFERLPDANTRLTSLAKLCRPEESNSAKALPLVIHFVSMEELDRFREDARDLFFQLKLDQQLAMFEYADTDRFGDELAVVKACIFDSIELRVMDKQQQTQLKAAICCALPDTADPRCAFAQPCVIGADDDPQ